MQKERRIQWGFEEDIRNRNKRIRELLEKSKIDEANYESCNRSKQTYIDNNESLLKDIKTLMDLVE